MATFRGGDDPSAGRRFAGPAELEQAVDDAEQARDEAVSSAAAAAGSAANALISETNAADSEVAASASETAAAASETAAAASEAAAAASYDSFDDRYLGAKSSDPALDNDGDALVTGAIYFNTTSGVMRVYNGVSWEDIASGTLVDYVYTASSSQTAFTGADDNAATLSIPAGTLQGVYLNGVKLVETTDYTYNTTTVTLTSGAALNDILVITVIEGVTLSAAAGAFLSTVSITNASPVLRLWQTGASTDETIWDVATGGGLFVVRLINDDDDTSQQFLVLDRTGMVPTSFTLKLGTAGATEFVVTENDVTLGGVSIVNPYAKKAMKTSDTSKTSDTTTAADPHLSLTVEGYNGYMVTGYFPVTCASLTPDLKLHLHATATNLTYGAWCAAAHELSISNSFGTSKIVNSDGATRLHDASGDVIGIEFSGTVYYSDTASKTLELYWAQNTSDATAVVMKTGAWLKAEGI